MFEQIKQYLFTFFLNRELKGTHVSREIINFSTIKRIGILYVLNDPCDYEKIENLVVGLHNQNKEVKALAYVTQKIISDRFLPKLSYDFFSKTKINWFYRPHDAKVTDFIRTRFDVLIDLSIPDCLPLHYILAKSEALCRVGPYSPGKEYLYDLMISRQSNATTEEYFFQVIHYLTIINQNEN